MACCPVSSENSLTALGVIGRTMDSNLTNFTNSSSATLAPVTAVEKGIEAGLLTVICIVALFGNICLWLVVLRSSVLRSNSNALVLCLSTADILVSSVNMPVTTGSVITGRWLFTSELCVLYGLLNMITFIASVMSLGAISINRYMLICHPNKFKRVFNKRNTALIIAGVWLLAFLLAFPPLVGWGIYTYLPNQSFCFCDWRTSVSYTFFMVGVCFGGPFSVMTFCYINILKVFRENTRKVADMQEKSLQSTKPSAHNHSMPPVVGDRANAKAEIMHLNIPINVGNRKQELGAQVEDITGKNVNYSQSTTETKLPLLSNGSVEVSHLNSSSTNQEIPPNKVVLQNGAHSLVSKNTRPTIFSNNTEVVSVKGFLDKAVLVHIPNKDGNALLVTSRQSDIHDSSNDNEIKKDDCHELNIDSNSSFPCESHSFSDNVTDAKVCSRDEGTYNTLTSASRSNAFKSNEQKLNSMENATSTHALKNIGNVNQKDVTSESKESNYSNFKEEVNSGDGASTDSAHQRFAKVCDQINTDQSNNETCRSMTDNHNQCIIKETNRVCNPSNHCLPHSRETNEPLPGQEKPLIKIAGAGTSTPSCKEPIHINKFASHVSEKGNETEKSQGSDVTLIQGKETSPFSSYCTNLPSEGQTPVGLHLEQPGIAHISTEAISDSSSSEPQFINDQQPHSNSRDNELHENEVKDRSRTDIQESGVNSTLKKTVSWRLVERREQLRVQNTTGKSSDTLASHSSAKKKKRQMEEVRLTTSLMVVILVFVVCWLPFCIAMFYNVFSDVPLIRSVDMTTLLLGYFNSCCNPIIYGLMNQRFRDGYKALFCRWRRGGRLRFETTGQSSS